MTTWATWTIAAEAGLRFPSAPTPNIDELLGATTLYEEHRGNFADARRQAEFHLAETRHTLVEALLARGIVHLLQGEAGFAKACFEKCAQHAQDSSKLHQQSLAWTLQAVYLNHNYFPNGGAASAADIRVVFDLKSYVEAWQRQVNAARAKHDTAFPEHRVLTDQNLVRLGRQAIFGSLDSGTQMRSIYATQFAQTLAAGGLYYPSTQAALEVQLADLWFGAKLQQEATETWDRAWATYARLSDKVGRANCQMKRGDWLVAPFGPPEVWNTAIATGALNYEFHWEVEAAEFDTSSCDVAGARRYYEEARKLFDQAGATRGLAAISLRMGYLATIKTSAEDEVEACYKQAIEHIDQACELYKRVEDWLGYQVARAHLALCRVGMGQQPEDRELARAIGEWGRTSGSFSFSLGLGLLFTRVARRWLIREGDYERALACFRLSAALFEELRAQLSHAVSLNGQMAVFELLGEHSEFLLMARRVSDVCEDILSKQQAIAAEAREQAIWVIMRVINTANERADPDLLANYAEKLKRMVGRPSVDPEKLKQMVGRPSVDLVFLQAQSVVEQAAFLEPLYRGRKARREGDVDAANKHFESARRVACTGRGFSQDFMEATVLSYQRLYEEARTPCQRYLQQELTDTFGIGEVAPTLQKDKERYTLQLALQWYINIKQYDDAEGYLAELESRHGPNWWNIEHAAWENLTMVAEVHERRRDWKRALDTYEQAMTTFEERRNQLSHDQLKRALAGGLTTRKMYFQKARTAITAHLESDGGHDGHDHLADAFKAIERGKARSLLDLMASGAAVGGEDTPGNRLLRRWRRLSAYLATRSGLLAKEHAQELPSQARIALFQGEAHKAEEELRTVEGKLSAADPAFRRAQSAGADVLELKDVASRLPGDSVILQYAFLGEELFSWAITNGGMVKVHFTELEDENLLERKIREYHQRCEQRTQVKDLDVELARILLGPFEDIIGNHKRLIVVPHGAAHILPFHALPWGEGDQRLPLAANHYVTYLPSASLIQFEQKATAQAPTVLAVGNPANMRDPGSGIELKSLPAAGTEAAYIAQLMPGSKPLIGNDATLAAVRTQISDYPILHFATHGNLNATVPLLSAIYLANGDTLSVFELMGLHMNADLVVLSACRTGQGEATRGDDVVGFSRALLAAGARAALVSLWPVHDAATSLFMSKFYEELRDGKAPPTALRAAQNYLRTLNKADIVRELNALKRDLTQHRSTQSIIEPIEQSRDLQAQAALDDEGYSHPYYWAPFVLVGAWANVDAGGKAARWG